MCDFERRIGGSAPPSHSCLAPLMEVMLHDARTGLTKVVVIGPGRAVLFYGRHSMGEGLMVDEARGTTFLPTGTGMWVGKLAYLAGDPMMVQEGRQAIAQAITDYLVKVRGPGHPHVNLLAQQPFRFDPQRGSPIKDASGDGGYDYQPSPHWPLRGWEHNRCQRDQRPPSPQFPSPSPDHGFESDRSSLSMTSSMSSRSDRSDGSQHSRWGRRHQEDGACMKINLLVFKDEDAKDVVTYHSWRWDLMVSMCRVQGPHSPILCNYILARLSWRASMELWYGYNFGGCVDNLGQTLQQCESTRCTEPGAIPTTDGG